MTFRYSTILVAVDGSDEAKRAFRKAVLLSKDHGAKLILVHIFEPRSTAVVGPAGPHNQTTFPEAEQYAIGMLDEYKELAEKEGASNVTVVLDYGSPKVKIAKDVAQKHNVDLIVTGATGLNAVERFLIGSVSQHITRHASCDVLIVRSETEVK
ncbi:universal stress protein [Alkalicoccus daliensis]|uniref:Universal stress protein n=1 Tax=Alkalicoccus daliensis TaxID=745820 RepID=A0A1H0GEN2_9BACI|nr:universal stress protein [Alkalicoccus daliensis]SDO05324.1 Nucleotide-binding universal stress protein, UspA family [Alkalicoccus daliensis]